MPLFSFSVLEVFATVLPRAPSIAMIRRSESATSEAAWLMTSGSSRSCACSEVYVCRLSSRRLWPIHCWSRHEFHSKALFDALLNVQNATYRRIAVALEWHRFALSNPRAISLAQRLIALKTGFEALSGASATHVCGAFLRRVFEDVTRPHLDLLPWAGILWSPKERTDLQRTWMRNNTPQPVVRSELEDWFATLGKARNEIIHDGTLRTVEYAAPSERPLSRYVGQLFWTADRMLRETIKALLSADVLLSARLKELEFWKKLGAALRAEREAAANGASTPQADSNDSEEADAEDDSGPVLDPNELETAAPADADEFEDAGEEAASVAPIGDIGARDLSQLLSALNCDAANKVRLEKPVGTGRQLWGASFAKRTIGIDEGEKNLLQSAGAEFPLPPTWSRAD